MKLYESIIASRRAEVQRDESVAPQLKTEIQ